MSNGAEAMDLLAPETDEAPGQRLLREAVELAARIIQLFPGWHETGVGSEQRTALEGLFRSVLGSNPLEVQRGTAPRDQDRRQRRYLHPIDRICRALALSEFEYELLLLVGMAEEHEALAALLRGLHPRGEARATPALAGRLLCRSLEEREFLRSALQTGPLARSGAVQLGGDGAFYERSLRPADALWSVFHGLDVWPVGIVRRRDRPALAGLKGWLATRSAVLAMRALRELDPRTVIISAENEETALSRGLALAKVGGVPAAVLAWDAKNRELGWLVSLHSLARGEVPLIKGPQRDVDEGPALAEHPGPILLCARTGHAGPQGGRCVVAVSVSRLSATERREAWAVALPELEEVCQSFAFRYSLEPAAALQICADARSLGALSGQPLTSADVSLSVRARSALSVSPSVRLVHAKAGFGELVLRESRIAQLREAVDRLRGQATVLDTWGFLSGRSGARGVRMLFSGPPGTGKTLSAEVLAAEIGVDLLVVDLANVVSKWIGETEKNLAEVFDAAERMQAVLFFDEADALFGVRTNVSNANDRYANLETAYLLSRLERYEGLAVLATNLRQNVDPAFLRRVEFVVDFEEPSPAEREALWRCHVPRDVPLAADVDFVELAALYPIVGGYIKNAAVAAAFLAAAEGTSLERRHFLHAVWREYEKAGRAFPGPAVPLPRRHEPFDGPNEEDLTPCRRPC